MEAPVTLPVKLHLRDGGPPRRPTQGTWWVKGKVGTETQHGVLEGCKHPVRTGMEVPGGRTGNR